MMKAFPRYLLSSLVVLLAVFAALPELAVSGEDRGLGMGAPASLILDTASQRLAPAPSAQVDKQGAQFDIALVSLAAAQWLLAGRYVAASPIPTLKKRLLKMGRLQLEGG